MSDAASLTATQAPSFSLQLPPAFLLAPLPQPPPPPPWHALIVRYGHEITTADRITRDLDLEAYCPTFLARWVHHGRRYERVYPYLRSYIFARWPAKDARLWHLLADLDGTLGFIGGPIPAPIPDEEIELLRELVSLDRPLLAVRRPAPIPLGTAVRVTAGTLAGREGCVTTSGDFFVDVEFRGLLGRDVSITVAANCCEPIAAASLPWERTQRQRRSRRGKAVFSKTP